MRIGLIVATEHELPDFEFPLNVEVLVCGMGRACAFKAGKVMGKKDINIILNLGICGGVDDGISEIGQVIKASSVSYKRHELLVQNIPYMPFNLHGIRVVGVETHDDIVHLKSQVSEGIAGVDLESYFIVEAAGRTPCLIIKVISDLIRERWNVQDQIKEIDRNFLKAKKSINLFWANCINSGLF